MVKKLMTKKPHSLLPWIFSQFCSWFLGIYSLLGHLHLTWSYHSYYSCHVIEFCQTHNYKSRSRIWRGPPPMNQAWLFAVRVGKRKYSYANVTLLYAWREPCRGLVLQNPEVLGFRNPYCFQFVCLVLLTVPLLGYILSIYTQVLWSSPSKIYIL